MLRLFRIILVVPLFLVFAGELQGQSPVVDSLETAVKNARKSEKPELLHQLCRYYFTSNNEKAEIYARQAYDISVELKSPTLQAQALNDLAKTYFFRGDYHNAESNYLLSLDLYRKAKDNNGIAGTLNNIGVLYRSRGEYEKALGYYQQSLEIKKKMDDQRGIANTLNNIGEIHKFRGDYPNAIRNYLESYKIKLKIGDRAGMANTLNNLGEIHSIRSEFEKALEYYLEAAALWDELHNLSGTAGAYHNIGEIYANLENYEMAGKYFHKALTLQRQTDDIRNQASSLRHLGEIRMKMMDYDSALIDFSEALSLEQRLENKTGISTTLESLGKLHFNSQEYEEALENYRNALKINHEIGNKKGEASLYNLMGEVYLQLGNPSEALKYFELSSDISTELRILATQQNNYLGMAHAYQMMGNYRKALDLYFDYQAIKDTLLTEQIHKQIAELETKYQTEQKEKELQLKDAELMRKDLELRQQNLQRNAVLVGLLLVILLASVIYRSYRQKQKANEILTLQKAEIELKNLEITDSIRYAKNIQNAFLPHEAYISELFQEFFVYFRPKDIVSGDFYWFGKSDGYSYAAAVDATGHGVPGAFISLLGYNLLNNILKENPGIRPARILDLLNRGFSERVFKSYQEHAIRDSMDIALCRISRKENALVYAGAYNPLWLVHDRQMTVIKGDKFPIGSYQEMPDRMYNEHEVNLTPGDVIYLFSDGYADQFGGEKGKKFMYRQLRELLLEIQNKPLREQHRILTETMNQWMKSVEQVDDQLIIGIRNV